MNFQRLMFALSLALTLAPNSGCVWRSTYDTLYTQHAQLQQKMAETTAQSAAERDNMSQQLGVASQSASRTAQELDHVKNTLALERQHAADVRTRVQQMWTIMQSIMTTLSPTAPVGAEPRHNSASLPSPPRM